MRRKKANVNDLFQMGIEWFDSQRCKRTDKTSKVITGTRFVLVKPMTDEQVFELGKFDNVIVGVAQHRHAPEIQHQTVILTDVCLH